MWGGDASLRRSIASLEDDLIRERVREATVSRHLDVVTTSLGDWKAQSFSATRPPTRDGEAAKPTLLLIHGTMSNALMFVDSLDALSVVFDVYAVDVPGFGVSTAPEALTTLPARGAVHEYAAFFDAWSRVRRVESAFVTGHSFGALLGFWFARRFPARVSHALMMSMPGALPTLGPYGYYWAAMFKARFPQTLMRRLSTFGFVCARGALGRNTEALYWYATNALAGGQGDKVLASHITWSPTRGFWNDPTLHEVLGLDAEVGFLWGSEDTITPVSHARLMCELSGGRVTATSIEGVGHGSPRHENGKTMRDKILEVYGAEGNTFRVAEASIDALERAECVAHPSRYASESSVARTTQTIARATRVVRACVRI